MKTFNPGDEVVYRAKRVKVWAVIGRQYLCRDGDVGILAHPEELKIDLLPKEDSLSVGFGQRNGEMKKTLTAANLQRLQS